MDCKELDYYWSTIPEGRENATDYPFLCLLWDVGERQARKILHELSIYDNGDDFVLIRSGKNKGFYKTNDPDEIKAFRRECLAKGRSNFAPVAKCNRILAADGDRQLSFDNNLRAIRNSRGLKQSEVCHILHRYGIPLDTSMLSKIENSVILPTPFQLQTLGQIYGVSPSALIDTSVYS